MRPSSVDLDTSRESDEETGRPDLRVEEGKGSCLSRRAYEQQGAVQGQLWYGRGAESKPKIGTIVFSCFRRFY